MPGKFKTIVPVHRVTQHWNIRNLVRQRHGKLLVLADSGNRTSGREVIWKCKCDCGNTALRTSSALSAGKTVSCGCTTYTQEVVQRRAMSQRKPGAALRRTYGAYRRAAKVRGLSFELTLEAFQKLTAATCYYCGDQPAQLKRSEYESYLANGIDRTDNNIGYAVENCVASCWRCNAMKLAMSAQEFIEHVRKIATRQEGRQFQLVA